MKNTNKIYEIFKKDSQYLNSDWNVKFRNETYKFLKKSNMFDNEFKKLEDIHIHLLDKSKLEYNEYAINDVQKYLYNIDESFIKIYHNFMKDLYKKLKFDFYFQKFPTIRVHGPDIDTKKYYPSYHSDGMFGHPPQDLNIWISLTDNEHSGFNIINAKDSKKWVKECGGFEKFLENKKEFKKFNKKGNKLSTEIKSGLNSVFIFDSVCIHSNVSRTKDTRVSIDVRINPVEGFETGYVGTEQMKAEFKPDGKFGYYKKSIGEM